MVAFAQAAQRNNINSSLGGNRLCVLADSFGINGARSSSYPQAYTSTTGPVAMLEALSFGRFTFDVDLQFATLGHTTTQMAARYDADVAANYEDFEVLWLDGGRNDDDTSKAAGDITVANFIAMATKALRNGKSVFIPTPNPPRSYLISTDNQRKVRGYVNREVKKWCVGKRGVAYVDRWRDWVDPTVSTGVPASGITTDGMHPEVTAAVRDARRVIDTVGFAFPLPYKEQSAWDWYDASLNPTGNLLALKSTAMPRLAGTGGSKTTFTGNVADNFSLSRLSGAGTEIVASKEAASAGYGSEGGDRQVLTVSTLSGDVGFILAGADLGAPPAGLVGQQVFGQFEVELASMVGNTSLNVFLQYWNGAENIVTYALNSGTGAVIPWPDGKLLLKTPEFTLTGAQSLQILVSGGFNSGGSGIIKLGAPGIWVKP